MRRWRHGSDLIPLLLKQINIKKIIVRFPMKLRQINKTQKRMKTQNSKSVITGLVVTTMLAFFAVSAHAKSFSALPDTGKMDKMSTHKMSTGKMTPHHTATGKMATTSKMTPQKTSASKKMAAHKMSADKMSSHKMEKSKMATDKMSKDKMGDGKMAKKDTTSKM
jgi:hypothetical protein